MDNLLYVLITILVVLLIMLMGVVIYIFFTDDYDVDIRCYKSPVEFGIFILDGGDYVVRMTDEQYLQFCEK